MHVACSAMVMAVAAGLRLWQSDLTPFLDDEASLLTRGLQLLETGHIPLVGGTFSIGIHEPPLMTFLLAPMLVVSRSPEWVTACFCVLDSLAALLVFFTGRQLAGLFAGLAAGLLYAVAPALIYFTRRTDYYGLIPVCTAIVMFTLVCAWQQRSALHLALALLGTAVAVQLHPISAMLLPVWIIVAVLLARHLSSYRPFIPVLALAALTLSPYVYLQSKTGWADINALVRFAQAPKFTDWSSLQDAATLVAGGTYQQLLAPGGQVQSGPHIPVPGWCLLALVVSGGASAVFRQRPAAAIVLALLLLPVLAGLRHTAGVLPYYMLPVLPPAAVLSGLALAAVPWRVGALGALAALAAWQAVDYVDFQSLVARSGPHLNYGMPLRFESQAARLLSLPAGSRVFVAQQGNQSASFPYLTDFRFQITHSDARYGISLPSSSSSGAEYVVQAGWAPYRFLDEQFGPPSAVVRTASGMPAFGLFRLPPDAARRIESALDVHRVDADFADGVKVVGYATSQLGAGQPSTAVIEWTIGQTDDASPAEVQQFLHLVDGSGTTWSSDGDERAYPRREWRAGDRVFTWFDLGPKAETPTGGYWLETGFYGYPSGSPLRTAGGGSSVRLGPVRVQGTAPEGAVGAPRAVFGQDEIGLLGMNRRGLDVTLQWEALSAPRGNYTVFVHLLNQAGEIVAQHDGPPQGGAFPTSLWQPGDVVRDVHHLVGSVDGTHLEVGLYSSTSLRRLRAERSDGSLMGDHLEVSA